MWGREIKSRLAILEAEQKKRTLRTFSGANDAYIRLEDQQLLNLASNNYLGLAGDLRLARAQSDAALEFGSGAAASRLVSGNHLMYEKAETALQKWKDTEAALICGSGYMANMGVLQSLAGRNDVVFSDRLNHASIVDGIVASRAGHKRYRHNDLENLERLLMKTSGGKRKIIVTDSVFSMDGDVADLVGLVRLKEKYDALLIVDEAHAGGVFGPKGRGKTDELNLKEKVDVQIGTFSKALGSYGAYITGRKWLIDYLINKMRSLIYTTALPPAILGAIIQSIQIVEAEPERREQLVANSLLFREQLERAGLHTYESTTQIIPVRVGSNKAALEFAEQLQTEGIAAIAIRPPTVPEGDARIRFAVSALHKEADLQDAAKKIIRIASGMKII